MTEDEVRRLARESLALDRATGNGPLAQLDDSDWQRALDGDLTVGELLDRQRREQPP